ncbi:MAG: response regulator transcription factor [Chlorobi bacterium]|nr:response regulator transcription factor [Chlorobiota bacterium]
MNAKPENIFSEKEIKIIRLLEKGLSNKTISERCNISENTVKYHLKNIYKKLGVHSRLQAVRRINKNNLFIN